MIFPLKLGRSDPLFSPIGQYPLEPERQKRLTTQTNTAHEPNINYFTMAETDCSIIDCVLGWG